MKVEANKLPNLTTDGFVKTSSSDGTLSIDTNTYLTSGDVTGFVPYTGATTNVDLGNHNLTTTGYGIFGGVQTTGGANNIIFDIGGANETSLYLTNNGKLGVQPTGFDLSELDFTALTATQTYTFPDQTGTIALTSDIPNLNSGILTFMFSGTNSDISGYESMPSLSTYTAGALVTKTTAGVSTTPTLLEEFATDIGFPNITVIPEGTFTVHYETQKNAGSNNYYTYAEIYQRDISNTETLLLTSDNSSSTAVNTIVQQTVTVINGANITLALTDRIVVKIYAVMVSSTATIDLLYDDTTNARMQMPSISVDASNFVPYVNATQDVDLGTNGLSTNDLTISTFTEGSIPFIGASGVVSEDNTNLWWDNTTKQMRVGPEVPVLVGLAEAVSITSGYKDGSTDYGYVSSVVCNLAPEGSGDVVISADDDDGTIETGKYIDLGINNSAFVPNSSFNILGPHGGYLLHLGGDLLIQTGSDNTSIYFATAGDTLDQVRLKLTETTATFYANKDTELIPTPLDAGDWTEAGGWSVTGGELVLASNAGPNTIEPTTPLTITAGVTYKVVVEVSAVTGNVNFDLGGVTSANFQSGTNTFYIVADNTDNLVFVGDASATCTITSVSGRALINNTGDILVEGNIILGSAVSTSSGATVFSADGLGKTTFAQIPLGPNADPTSANEFARKAYVDSVAAGFFLKDPVRVATTTAGTLASSFENGDTIDGVTLATNDRILIKNQASQSENGIYTVNASGAPTRATDSDTAAEVKAGTFCLVQEGTQAGSQFMQTATVTTLNTDPLTYSQFNEVTTYTASNGVQLSGTNFSAKLSATGAVTLTGTGSDELTVAVDNSSIERSGNALRVKAGGITNSMIANTAVANLSGTNTGDQTTISGNAGTATALQTARNIYGNSFDGTADVTGIIASNFGGTGNGFTKFTGPTTAEKTFTLPDSNATLLYSGGALGTPSSGTVTNLTGTASININGTVGATTPTTGKFTTVETTGGIEIGNPSDTTLTRVSAGVAAIEGNTIVVNSSSPTLGTITTTGDINLGNADTTLSRLSAGVLGVEGKTVATLSTDQTWTGTQLFTQQRFVINAITAVGNAATVPITHRIHNVTNNSAATLTITMTAGGAFDGQIAIVRIYDFSAVPQTLVWSGTQNSQVSVPTITNGSTTQPLTVGFMYNSLNTAWRCIAVS